jgi:molecular chaperone GrpE
VLADFRIWLQEAAAGPLASPPPTPTPDLHTLLGQMIALRQEVNLQTKAARAQQEQNTETLRELTRALDSLTEPAATSEPVPADDALRGMLKVLVDIADALTLARREFTRGRAAFDAALQALAAPPPTSWLDRLLGRSAPPVDLARVTPMIDSLVTGYTMSLQRVERALQQLGLERMECKGQAFDPERMEAVEVVADSGQPAGQVVEEVRPGYRLRGRVFRFAQVTVSR